MKPSEEDIIAPESESLVATLRSLARPGWSYQGTTMDGEVAERSVQPFLVSMEKRIFPDEGKYRPSVRIITSSLLLPFLARQSLHQDWWSKKNLGRLVRSMRKVAQRVQNRAVELEQKYVKYWIDRLLWKLVGDINPYPDPKPFQAEPLFSGFCLRYLQRRLARQDDSFIYSLQRGAKLSWPQLPIPCLLDALKEHEKSICVEPTPIGGEMFKQIFVTSHALFADIMEQDLVKFCPTSSACFEASRAHLGAQSLFSPLELPIPSGLGRLREISGAVDKVREEEFQRTLEFLKTNGINFDVKVVAIPEPGKYRIISKGSGYLYSILQPIQGAMLDAWKNSPVSTMLSQDLTEKVQDLENRRPPEFDLWASVDYSSATDKLKRAATMAACEGLSLPMRGWAQVSFSQGRVFYPRVENPDGTTAREERWNLQGEGQLMGHPLSFPLLCTINLACFRRACDLWIAEAQWGSYEFERRRDLSLDLLNLVIVNGDDMLFPCCRRLYEIFCNVVTEVGFQFSPGKNYVSRTHALINSQLFRISHGHVRRCDYLNQRLIQGHCLKSGSSQALPTQIAAVAGDMVASLPWTRCVIPKIMQRWKRRGKFVPNWYLPVHLGGYGLSPVLAPNSWSVSHVQRRMAARFIREPTLSLYRVRGVIPPPKEFKDLVPRGTWSSSVPDQADNLDRWAQRMEYVRQWMHGHAHEEREHFPRQLSVIRSLKPVGEAGFVKYWNRFPVPTFRAPCPPLHPLRFPYLVQSKPTPWINYSWGMAGSTRMAFTPVIAQIVDHSVESSRKRMKLSS